jgi:hypothetical protein
MPANEIPRATTEALIKAFKEYVVAAGWKPIVFEGTGIRKGSSGRAGDYEFVIRFTGIKTEDVL